MASLAKRLAHPELRDGIQMNAESMKIVHGSSKNQTGTATVSLHVNPSHTEKQRKFMGAELGRLRAGKKTHTGMSAKQLEDFASKPLKKKGK